MSDKEKENEVGTISIEEIGKIFFGDESKIDLGPGRPRKDVSIPDTGLLSSLPEEDDDKPVDEELYPNVEVNDEDQKKDITATEKYNLDRQVRFLKKYEDRKKKLKVLEKKFDLEKETKQEIKQQIRDEKEKQSKNKIKGASYLVKYRDATGSLYGKGGKILVTECNHVDNYFGIDANQILSRCTKCSRTKKWDTQEWEFYQQNKYKSC